MFFCCQITHVHDGQERVHEEISFVRALLGNFLSYRGTCMQLVCLPKSVIGSARMSIVVLYHHLFLVMISQINLFVKAKVVCFIRYLFLEVVKIKSFYFSFVNS